MVESPTRGPPIVRRLLAATAGLLLVLGGAVSSVAREEQEATDRIAGADRVATAANIAAVAFPDGADIAIVARRDAFPDALAAGGLAGANEAPILLTDPNRLDDRTRRALDELGVSDVHVVGGPEAISEDVVGQLRDGGRDVTRIGGADRFATAREVALAMDGEAGGIEGRGARIALLASGRTFPDAVVAGPVANAGPFPVLLTPEARLHPAAAEAIDQLAIDHVVVVGGPHALTTGIEDDLDALGVTHERVAGRDRTDTAAAMATWALAHAGFDATDVLVARGDAFPDALAAAPLAGRRLDPLLLTRTPGQASHDLLQWIVDRADDPGDEPTIERVRALGGEAAVTADLLEHLAEAAAPPERIMSYSVEPLGEVTADLAYFAEHVDWTLTDPRGWALGHDVRWDRLDDPGAVDVNVYLATPSEVGAAADGCSSEWSCQPAGTNDVYINEDHWEDATASYRQAGRTLDAYRHYVVLHEFGHAPPMDFGHIRCEDVHDDPPGEPAPVMEQQSIARELGACRTRVWPLQPEREIARDRLLGQGSTLTQDDEDRTYAP